VPKPAAAGCSVDPARKGTAIRPVRVRRGRVVLTTSVVNRMRSSGPLGSSRPRRGCLWPTDVKCRFPGAHCGLDQQLGAAPCWVHRWRSGGMVPALGFARSIVALEL